MAAASAHRLPLITLSSADVYSVYVGDAEATIRRSFRIARQSSPCILFMDELDAIVTNRGGYGGIEGNTSSVEARVMATLLTEMDGIDGGNDGVVVIGATNRIECIDAALIRKGRFHHVLEVKPPSSHERLELIQYFSRKFQLPLVVQQTLEGRTMLLEEASGADIEGLCREAAMELLRGKIANEVDI